jgi:hypothetical protein
MARDNGYLLHTSLPDTTNNIESLAAGTALNTLTALRLLLEDSGVVPPGHRYHLLATGPSAAFWLAHRELGVGAAFNASSTYDNYFALHTGYRNADSAWLTGVVYSDANGNGRFDLGEGVAGVTIAATGPGTLNATSNAAGGWSLAVTAGTWNLSASGGAFIGTSTGSAAVSTQNIEVDFESGTAAAEVGFANQGSPPPPPPPPSTSSSGKKKKSCGLLGVEALLLLAALRMRRYFFPRRQAGSAKLR